MVDILDMRQAACAKSRTIHVRKLLRAVFASISGLQMTDRREYSRWDSLLETEKEGERNMDLPTGTADPPNKNDQSMRDCDADKQ